MQHILWEIPLAVVNQGIHVILADAGCKLKRAIRASNDEYNDIAKKLNI